MTSLCRIALFLAVLITLSGGAFASCQDFLNDVDTTSMGVSVRKDAETGKIKSFLFVGEASFIAPKSSLVRKAKKKAFMNAKAEFARFMKEEEIYDVIKTWLSEPFEGGRHKRRIEKLDS